MFSRRRRVGNTARLTCRHRVARADDILSLERSTKWMWLDPPRSTSSQIGERVLQDVHRAFDERDPISVGPSRRHHLGLEPVVHATHRHLRLNVDRVVVLDVSQPGARASMHDSRGGPEATLCCIEPSATHLKRRLARWTSREETVVVRPRYVGRADGLLDVSLERTRSGQRQHRSRLDPPQYALLAARHRAGTCDLAHLLSLDPEVPSTKRCYRDNRDCRHPRSSYPTRTVQHGERRSVAFATNSRTFSELAAGRAGPL